MTSVVVADDHPIFRRGLRTLLEAAKFDVVGEGENGRDAVQLTRRLTPDVAILDVSMPLLNGVDAAREIRRLVPRTYIVLLSMYNEEIYVQEGLRAGIHGYVLKSQTASDLVTALQEVLTGSIYLSPGLSRGSLDGRRLRGGSMRRDPLSPRERQVLQLVAEGMTTKQIASVLSISVKTADSHRTRIMRKLDLHETASLVRYAIRSGLVRP